MIHLKSRTESLELKLQKLLLTRMNLTHKERSNFSYNIKGFEREKQFDQFLEKYLTIDCLVLHDLLLETNNTFFQINTMLISQKTIQIFEVKNYEGDYFIEADKWYSVSQKEINNPIEQLTRSTSLLRRLLQDLGIECSIKCHLVFINPEFTLYHAPMNLPIIFHSQLNRFIKNFNKSLSKLNQSHTNLTKKIMKKNLIQSPYTIIPKYSYKHIEKGMLCLACNSFISKVNTTYLLFRVIRFLLSSFRKLCS
jgi:hypothetical protein